MQRQMDALYTNRAMGSVRDGPRATPRDSARHLLDFVAERQGDVRESCLHGAKDKAEGHEQRVPVEHTRVSVSP